MYVYTYVSLDFRCSYRRKHIYCVVVSVVHLVVVVGYDVDDVVVVVGGGHDVDDVVVDDAVVDDYFLVVLR